jgi:type II secretory pathway pseudopilin PulG
VAVLALIALVSIGLAAAGPSWSERLRREREQELLKVGSLYARAIASYRDDSPGTSKTYPQTLDVLLSDPRFIGQHRHLRRLYADPLAPARPWGLVRDIDGHIMGVYSQSDEEPLAQGPQALGPVVLAPARHYADWKFLAPTPS